MAAKLKTWFKKTYNEMIESRQRQVNRMIALHGYKGLL